jgi:zinc protease
MKIILRPGSPMKTQIQTLVIAAGLLAASFAHAALPIQNWTTAGGARVYFVEARTLPMLDVSVVFAAGSSRDPANLSGLASMTQGLMDNGAGGLNEDEISTRFANVGAVLGGSFDNDRAGLSLRTLSNAKERQQALEVFAKVLQEPEFPESVVERQKNQLVASLGQSNTEASSVADRQFMKLLYQDHPYSQKPTTETAQAIKRDDILKFYRTYYSSDNAVVAMIGDVSRAEAESIAESLTAKLPKRNGTIAELAMVKLPEKSEVKEVQFPSSQSHIIMGYPGIKRTDPDYFPLVVGNYILGGGGFSSRLTEEVREKRGLVYNVSSYFLPMRDMGPYRIALQTRKDQTTEALQVVRDTIRDFIEKGPTEEELTNAKRNLMGGFPLRIDSNRKILEYLEVIGFYSLPLSFLEDYVKNVDKVTVALIKDAFKRRIVPDNMVTVVVGVQETAAQKAETK